ncbi:MAG: hypothetical protein KAT68_19130 [Bacteroidales bacterium]|nr:hypothetical protein [Bacteroidales bacterium]
MDEKRQKYCQVVASKRINSLLGGPITEAYYIQGINTMRELEINFNDPDYKTAYLIRSFQLATMKNYLPYNIIHDTMMLCGIIKLSIFWTSIKKISHILLKSDTHTLERVKIEKILEKNGFFKYLDKRKNNQN